MVLTNLVPWGCNRSPVGQSFAMDRDPFLSLQREVNRMLDDFSRGFWAGMPVRFGLTGTWPQLEVTETDKEVKVVAELPGLEEKDIQVSLKDGVLTLKGEKKGGSNGALYSERWYGQFQRSVVVGPDIDPDKVSAVFKDGVLTITLAKRAEAQSETRQIPISHG